MPASDWQTSAALIVVALTALTFLVRALRRRGKNKGCHSCSCGKGGNREK